MGLFDLITQFSANASIRRLEAAVLERPTPALCLQLAEAHKKAGNGVRTMLTLIPLSFAIGRPGTT